MRGVIRTWLEQLGSNPPQGEEGERVRRVRREGRGRGKRKGKMEGKRE